MSSKAKSISRDSPGGDLTKYVIYTITIIAQQKTLITTIFVIYASMI
jgi:hypothetical protein